MNTLVPLSEASQEIGAKASRLRDLAAAGFPVPKAYVVPNLNDIEAVEDLREEVDQLLSGEFAGRRVVVRSSASDEDHPAAVAPGVYETLLGLSSTDQVLQAMRVCVASLNSADALAYRAMQGLVIEPAMSVLVQEVVECDASGVLYTHSPTTERPVMLAQWTKGLGTEVVAGTSDAQVLELSRADVQEGALRDWTFDGTNPWPLLARLGLLLEERYNGPQDIEWGSAGSCLYVFQSRAASMGGVAVPGWADRPETTGVRGEVISRGYAIGYVSPPDTDSAIGDLASSAALPSLVVVDELPSAQGVHNLLRADGVVARRTTVLSHAAAMVRESGLPALSIGAAIDDLPENEPHLLDAVTGVLAPLSELGVVDRKKAVFAWARQRASRGSARVRAEDKYEGVIIDPVLQRRLRRRTEDRGGVWRVKTQRIIPFDFAERVYCGIGARIQQDIPDVVTRVQFKYARPLPDRPYRFDQEVAIYTDGVEDGRRLLHSLDYREYAAQERRIEEHRPEAGVRICVNKWPGATQSYIGVEGSTVEQLERVLAELQVPPTGVHALDGKDLFDLLGLRLDSLIFSDDERDMP